MVSLEPFVTLNELVACLRVLELNFAFHLEVLQHPVNPLHLFFPIKVTASPVEITDQPIVLIKAFFLQKILIWVEEELLMIVAPCNQDDGLEDGDCL